MKKFLSIQLVNSGPTFAPPASSVVVVVAVIISTSHTLTHSHAIIIIVVIIIISTSAHPGSSRHNVHHDVNHVHEVNGDVTEQNGHNEK